MSDSDYYRELAGEMNRSLTCDGSERECRCCGEMWKPAHWNFYDLCDDCFWVYDSQKRERGGIASCNEWIAARQSA